RGGALESPGRAPRAGSREGPYRHLGPKKGRAAAGGPADPGRPGGELMTTAVHELAPVVGVVAACAALAVSRATFYRHQAPARPPTFRPTPPRALPPERRRDVLAMLNSERFADKAPRQVWADLLDEEKLLCSVRTMYRILAASGEVRERRDQIRHPAYAKPELLATAPNQVWSWDISKLKGPVKWAYFYLYVVLDIFSRYAVGWMVASRESAAL